MTNRERRFRRRDEKIAALLKAPKAESVEQQRRRTEAWAAFALQRLQDSGQTAYQRALDAEAEPHWWRDLSFVLADNTGGA